MKKLPTFDTKNVFSRFLKVGLAAAYAGICALIIIPQIDQQPWYPEAFQTFDLPQGIEFSQHKQSKVDLSETDLENWQLAYLFKLLNVRMKTAEVSETRIEYKEGTTRPKVHEIRTKIPDLFTETFHYQLFAKGFVEFLSPKISEEAETDPMYLFDRVNYVETDLKQSDIRTAKITNTNEQFTYIELRINSDKADTWNDFAVENQNGNIGLSIDGFIYQAWLLPADGQQIKHPTLVIAEREPTSLMMLSYLRDGPLPTESLSPIVETRDALFSQREMYVMFGLLGLMFVAGLTIRKIITKEPWAVTIAMGFLILGSLALIKLTNVPVSIALLLTLSLLTATVLITPYTTHLLIFGGILLLGMIMNFAYLPNFVTLSLPVIIFGLFGLLSTFFYQFMSIYEEN